MGPLNNSTLFFSDNVTVCQNEKGNLHCVLDIDQWIQIVLNALSYERNE